MPPSANARQPSSTRWRSELLSLCPNHLTTTMAHLIDLEAFRVRVEAIPAVGESLEVQEFLEAWQRADRGDRD